MKPKAHTLPTCPITRVAELLCDTWTILIIHNLLDSKSLRFCELERALDGISTRTLTLKLKNLESESIIKKTDEGYFITKQGLKIRPIMNAMEKFGKAIK
jgi:DNA-binding HxlR family transcriptional regulator